MRGSGSIGAERVKQSAAECWGMKDRQKVQEAVVPGLTHTHTHTDLTANEASLAAVNLKPENPKWETHVYMSPQLHQY